MLHFLTLAGPSTLAGYIHRVLGTKENTYPLQTYRFNNSFNLLQQDLAGLIKIKCASSINITSFGLILNPLLRAHSI